MFLLISTVGYGSNTSRMVREIGKIATSASIQSKKKLRFKVDDWTILETGHLRSKPSIQRVELPDTSLAYY